MSKSPWQSHKICFFQHSQPEGPPVEDIEGGSGDQEIQEEWVDALPELDTSVPLGQEEFLEKDNICYAKIKKSL